MRWCLGLVVIAGGCGDQAAPSRQVVLETTVDATGWSPELELEVPGDVRSVTIVVEGATSGLYALGGLRFADGVERVGLTSADLPGEMQASYYDEQTGQLAGDLYQSIRLGTFTHVYPYRPGQVVVPGAASLRVVSDAPGPVRVTILMPEDTDARTLPLNLYMVSDTVADPATAPFVAELDRIVGQAGLALRLSPTERLSGTGLAQITESTEPQEAPGSQAAMLPSLVAHRDRAGLDVFFVESLPVGIGGLSLGTPGPPLRGSYYGGVIVRAGLSPVESARVVAHEVSHFLALQHLQNVGASGTRYPDPLDDTEPGQGNLMENGTVLTPDQAFALSRSALLVDE